MGHSTFAQYNVIQCHMYTYLGTYSNYSPPSRQPQELQLYTDILSSGKLSRKRTFANFEAIYKSLLHEILGSCSFWHHKRAIGKSFLCCESCVFQFTNVLSLDGFCCSLAVTLIESHTPTPLYNILLLNNYQQ